MGIQSDLDEDSLAEMHEINVTPFIDVMLVLLIIFMVVAPLTTVNIPVDLPVSTAKPQPQSDKPLYLTIRADLTLLVGDVSVTPELLELTLNQATGGDKTKRVFLRADKTVAYGTLMGVMNNLQATGYLKVALVGLEDTRNTQ
ncbi:biopolymer transporter [Candidatus Nitrosoglobus terrae]|uniref:Biopolymer transport protein ExbD n=1 Tax=Candidatus Nitrosoglobus terrae TaxID=1630141 RepID=A0A1Q2SMY7_9GAMM|nr:TonB system transport protein ExbD [Candidatus Nitrosoglobus terrae]BAW80482.1 biopolymer transporter [Candidatus Nitrosoglobus terrae]